MEEKEKEKEKQSLINGRRQNMGIMNLFIPFFLRGVMMPRMVQYGDGLIIMRLCNVKRRSQRDALLDFISCCSNITSPLHCNLF